jgi:putative transposase
MDDAQSLSHTVWNCKYHVVWIPKYRRKVVYGELRKHLGEVFRELALQKESKVVEGHLLRPPSKCKLAQSGGSNSWHYRTTVRVQGLNGEGSLNQLQLSEMTPFIYSVPEGVGRIITMDE